MPWQPMGGTVKLTGKDNADEAVQMLALSFIVAVQPRPPFVQRGATARRFDSVKVSKKCSPAQGREALEGGEGGGGFGRTPPPPWVPLWSPPKGGRKILKLKSSWHRRRRSKNLAVSLKHYKRRREGGRGSRGGEVGGGQGRYPPSSYSARPF